jgi:TRAP-type C4-dicarboxylate transport system permease small subunit
MTEAFYAAYAFVRKVNGVCIALACLMIAGMAVFTLWEVITRYFFRQPATWTYPIVSYMLLYSIYLAVAYTLQRGRHVSVDFIVEMVPARPRRMMERLGHLLGLIFSVVFLLQTWRLFVRHASEGQRDISDLSLPLAPASIVLVIGMGLMSITYVFIVADSFLRPPGMPTIQDDERAELGTAILADID